MVVVFVLEFARQVNGYYAWELMVDWYWMWRTKPGLDGDLMENDDHCL